MTTVVVAAPVPILQFFADDGSFLVGGQLFTTVGGIPYPTYADAAGQIQHANPIILNSRGEIATSSGQSAQLFLVPDVTYTFALFDAQSNPIDTPTNIQGIPTDASIEALITDQFVGALIYPLNAGEQSIGVTPTDFTYPVGHVYRYGSNPFPGGTDMTATINTACNVCRSVGCTLQVPTYDILLVSASIDITSLNVQGLGSPFGGSGCIQASSDQFDVLTINPAGFAEYTVTNLSVNGGWDGTTAGLNGNIVALMSTSPAHPYLTTFINCSFSNAKRSQVLINRGGYTTFIHCHSLGAGLHGLELVGTSTDLCTSVRTYGGCQWGSTPNGYGISIVNCASCAFHDDILEDTLGISLDGTTNRAINFDGVYQENFTVTRPNGLFITDTAGGIGLRIKSCFGGNFALPPFTNWRDVDAPAKSNSNLAINSVPYASSINTQSAGQGFISATGDVTAAQLTLTPGNYRIAATAQTIVNTVSGGSASQLACTITTNPSASGLSNSTNADNFIDGADQTQSFGTNQDARVSCETVVQVTTTPVTYYLRVHVALTGTISEGYYGQLRAFLLN